MTTSNNTFKSKVFKAAWTSLRNGKSKNMSQALKSAWAWAKKTLIEPIGVTSYHIVRETEKAVCIAGQLACYVTDQVVKSNLWIPKSLVKNSTIPQWIFDKKVEEAISSHAGYGGGRTLEFELA